MPGQVYEFDGFRLDTEKRLLSRAGAPIPLTPRVFETLLYLVQNSGVVLDKERLMEAVWPDSIVEENNLTQNISALRRVFGETPGSHRYIVTIPGRGYRFVANVRSGTALPGSSGQSDTVASNGATQPSTATDPSLVSLDTVDKKRNPLTVAFALTVIGALIFTAVFAFRMRETSSPKASTITSAPALQTKSVAVLPFENLSVDPENAHFASGIQDEVLSNLAQIADLKVISRTSANLYRTDNPRNAREIGQQLGVAHLLEGSVQRSGTRIRVHAQLIDTRSDSHLWAQTYDRDLADLFAIQSEIAQAIATQLQAKISEREKASINQPATSDPIANGLYMQALALEPEEPEYENHLKAVDLLEQAVARDPNFFAAFCALSRMNLTIYVSGRDHSVARRERIETANQKALQLRPDAGQAHLVLAHYYAFGLRDYDRARDELDLARRTLPNDADVYFQTGIIDRRQGRWSEAVRNFDRALELDPRNAEVLGNASGTYAYLRRYSEAAALCRRLLSITPNDYWGRLHLPGLQIEEFANLQPYREELDRILAEDPEAGPKIATHMFDFAIISRDAAAANKALTLIPPDGVAGGPELIWPRQWCVGYAARLFNRPEEARSAFEQARIIVEKMVKDEPSHALAWSLLGRINSALGQKEDAIKGGRHACEILPLSREATSGLRPFKDLAKIYAWVGEKDLALEQLSKILEQSFAITYGDLKLNPDWDPLRDDPRFDKMIASLAPKATGAAK